MTKKQIFLKYTVFFLTIYNKIIIRELGVLSFVSIVWLAYPKEFISYVTLYAFVVFLLMTNTIVSVCKLGYTLMADKKLTKVEGKVSTLLLDIYNLIVLSGVKPEIVEKYFSGDSDRFLFLTAKQLLLFVSIASLLFQLNKIVCKKENKNMFELVKSTEINYEVGVYEKTFEREYKLIGLPLYYSESESRIRERGKSLWNSTKEL